MTAVIAVLFLAGVAVLVCGIFEGIGHEKGYKKGEEEGFLRGYKEGFKAGEEIGYSEGRQKGYEDKVRIQNKFAVLKLKDGGTK